MPELEPGFFARLWGQPLVRKLAKAALVAALILGAAKLGVEVTQATAEAVADGIIEPEATK